MPFTVYVCLHVYGGKRTKLIRLIISLLFVGSPGINRKCWEFVVVAAVVVVVVWIVLWSTDSPVLFPTTKHVQQLPAYCALSNLLEMQKRIERKWIEQAVSIWWSIWAGDGEGCPDGTSTNTCQALLFWSFITEISVCSFSLFSVVVVLLLVLHSLQRKLQKRTCQSCYAFFPSHLRLAPKAQRKKWLQFCGGYNCHPSKSLLESILLVYEGAPKINQPIKNNVIKYFNIVSFKRRPGK